jgi:hypothetical protein
MAAAASASDPYRYPRRDAVMRGTDVDVKKSYAPVIRFLPGDRYQCLICEARLGAFPHLPTPAPVHSMSSSSNPVLHVASCCSEHLVKEHLSLGWIEGAARSILTKNKLNLVELPSKGQTTLPFVPTPTTLPPIPMLMRLPKTGRRRIRWSLTSPVRRCCSLITAILSFTETE